MRYRFKVVDTNISYSSKKGYAGQYEFRDYLKSVFKKWGYDFISLSGSEKNRKLSAGDVILRRSTDPADLCVLKDYFLEAKARSTGTIVSWLKKAEDDSEAAGKRGAILYAKVQSRGHHGYSLIAMTPATFKRIIEEYQELYTKDVSNS